MNAPSQAANDDMKLADSARLTTSDGVKAEKQNRSFQSGSGVSPIRTQPNEARCEFTDVINMVPIKDFCPISHNPAGGHIEISYTPAEVFLEVVSLRSYVDSYKGGKGEIRSMEGTIQAIAQDCANSLKVCVTVVADLYINPLQGMKLKCVAFPVNE